MGDKVQEMPGRSLTENRLGKLVSGWQVFVDVRCSHNETSTRVQRGADNGSIRTSSAPSTIRRSPARLNASLTHLSQISRKIAPIGPF
ncbi:hypothetical protein AXFE_18540 [Acidithrix ferrooxidans]|uniref:Uncharacterized protein n=1 Tax=Acidithrix ferrooxidans TaxID=1280514 RepID=A0A0D8HHF2_9ACTN|nr:hypothetical protein AXFE_18540 [Acidithrix ferrooxidans]